MITITDMGRLPVKGASETLAVVRSMKQPVPYVDRQEALLSPSWKLFQMYLDLRKRGMWNQVTFESRYVPAFLKEMEQPEPKRLLDELAQRSSQGEHICLCCYCKEEALCHRTLLAALLRGRTAVSGCDTDYSRFVRKDG